MRMMDIVAYESSHMGESWVSTNVKLRIPIQTLQYQSKLGLNGGKTAAGDAKRTQAELNIRRPSCCPSLAHSLDFGDTMHGPVFLWPSEVQRILRSNPGSS